MAWGYGAWVVLEVSEVHVLPVPGPSVFLQAPWSRSWVVGCVRVAMDTSSCRESLLAACPTPCGTYPPSSSTSVWVMSLMSLRIIDLPLHVHPLNHKTTEDCIGELGLKLHFY